MSEKSRRSRIKAATKARSDQGSDPKSKYKIRRKLPAPSLHEPESDGTLKDEQLAMPFVTPRRVEAQPFLKWAGGKASLLRQLEEFFPHEIDRYFEPFLGGGAVFFHLKHRFPDMRPFLRDSNKELINSFRVVRDRPKELMEWLDDHARRFRADGDDYYYAIRKQHDLTDDLARAARTIFLNKTCFNGLWRVNARAEFNTPVGSNKNPNLYSRDNIMAASDVLQNAQLEAQDFRKILDEARRGDFVYLDPPYLPISAHSDFKRYTPDQFRDADQVELANVFRELDVKGCRLALSNSEHPRTRELYADFSLTVVTAPRFINCKAKGRGNVSELVITNAKQKQKPAAHFATSAEPTFPETKYMGSKQRLLPFIFRHFANLRFNTVLDAFSGSGCVGYGLKRAGARVYTNDFLKFCFHIARATVENNATLLNEDDINRLLRNNPSALTFVRDTYTGLFFDEIDCAFLDNLWANIGELDSPLKKSLALSAASRACMKKRPRGLFTFTGKKGWDGRRDLKLSMREQFLEAVIAFNSAVFSNAQQNKAFNLDVFDLDPTLAEVVYLDPPYISRYSDCDYTRRYHFVEGFCQYWKDCEIMEHTSTKKIRSYETEFSNKNGAVHAFEKLFHHFRKSTLVVSYSSNSVPGKSEMVKLLKQEKSQVTVFEAPHRYHHGNHALKVGNNMNEVTEYLFVAQ